MPPMTGARPLELKQSALKNMIQRTAFAVAMDETKAILTGELLEIESDRVTLVALDGYRPVSYTHLEKKQKKQTQNDKH